MTEVLEEFGIEQTRPREYALVFRHSNGQDLALSQSKCRSSIPNKKLEAV